MNKDKAYTIKFKVDGDSFDGWIVVISNNTANAIDKFIKWVREKIEGDLVSMEIMTVNVILE